MKNPNPLCCVSLIRDGLDDDGESSTCYTAGSPDHECISRITRFPYMQVRASWEQRKSIEMTDEPSSSA